MYIKSYLCILCTLSSCHIDAAHLCLSWASVIKNNVSGLFLIFIVASHYFVFTNVAGVYILRKYQ